MKPSRTLAFMSNKTWIYLVLILLSSSRCESHKETPSAGLLCVSDCQTCPVVCSPPPSPPKSPPPAPPTSHHSPPESYYIAPPVHPAPAEGEAVPPPPPELYPVAPGMVQQNFSYPYYYFYASKAAECSLSLHRVFIVFVLFVLSHVVL